MNASTAKPKQLSVSAYMLSEIRRRGIERVFGVPGRENASILFNEVPDLEFVTARVEFNAGIMAEFTGRMTHRPQAVFCTMGPGATNMVTPTASAMLNHTPLLVVTFQLESDDRFYNHTHQCVDQRRIFEPVTKWSHEVEHASEIPAVLDRAFHLMMTEPVGPVHISLPVDLLSKTLPVKEFPAPQAPAIRWPRTKLSEGALRRAHKLLRSARKPLCLVGYEAIRAGAEEDIRNLCTAWNMPLLAAANAKGILPHDHPLNVGAASCYMEGILQYPTALSDLFGDVDVIVNIGYQYVDDILPKMWSRGKKKKVIHISAHSAEPIAAKYSPEIEVLGHIPATLQALLAKPVAKKAPVSLTKLRKKMNDVYEARSRGTTMTPVEVIKVVNENLDNGTLLTDIGYYRHHAILFSRLSRTRQFHTDSGLSTFGCGLPSAIAAQFLDKTRPVFLLCGDGGFHSGSCDLETLARHSLPVVVIVLNNSSFELIERYQLRGGRGHNPDVVSFAKVNFVKLAEANGITAARAKNRADLRRIIQARDKRRPLLIEVPLAYDARDKFAESF